jgi:glutamine amidotransferase
MLTIVDYGLGNLNSVANMIRHVGGTCRVTGDPGELAEAEKFILPGVGAFDRGMEALRGTGIADALSVAVLERKKPILGICLGMQLMANRSQEGNLSGLGWLDADVRKFCLPALSGLKIPHMGWNTVNIVKSNPLLDSSMGEQRFYFVHSYHVVCTDSADVLATAHHGMDFCAAIQKGNIFGAQFHPEKSHRFGMALMKRFLEL